MLRNTLYNKILAVGLAILAFAPAANASQTRGNIAVQNPALVRDNDKMNVEMTIDFTGLKVRSSGATVVRPMIVNGSDTLDLPAVSVYGRSAWYAAQRNNRMPVGGFEGTQLRYSSHLAPINYSRTVEYQPWMNGAELVVDQINYGCTGCNEGALEMDELARYRKVEYKPVFIYQAVVADSIKSRELSGRAYVDFPVNRTELYPEYRRNSAELLKIISTIDSVRNDKDITVTSITIKGFASPEGAYENNIRLAKGRTETLKNYVENLYKFAPGFIATSYEPEDWEGLKNYVENSAIENRQGILDIIDSDLAPDPKNTAIQKTYPVQYAYLLREVYPGLRHSDYRIEYVIRNYTNPEEIREILAVAPQKLSLGEIYLAVQDLEPGTDQYNEIFETAVRLFPGEPAANLNAANAALQRGDLIGAERYLAKAGDSANAVYARGVLAALKGDYTDALKLMNQAAELGLEIDPAIIENVTEAAK